MALLLALGMVLTLGASVAIWLDRQALSDAGWTDTSGQLLRDPTVRSAVGDEIVTQLFERTDLESRLHSSVGPLASPAAAELHTAAGQAAVTLLGTPQVQQAWRDANSEAHRQLVADIEHDRNRDVSLQLGPLLQGLLRQLRRSEPIKGLPVVGGLLDGVQIGDAGKVTVLRADQVARVRVAINTIRNLVLVLSLLAGICFAIAVAVAVGRHLRALAYVGGCLAACGGILLGLRALAGPVLVDALVPDASSLDRAAVRATWLVATTQLRTCAIVLLVVGGVLLIGGAVAAVISTRRAPVAPAWGP